METSSVWVAGSSTSWPGALREVVVEVDVDRIAALRCDPHPCDLAVVAVVVGLLQADGADRLGLAEVHDEALARARPEGRGAPRGGVGRRRRRSSAVRRG